jgi:hypothetical protein
MGVGAALALGLIQGFTKNIEKEQQSRQLDRDTLRNANNLMLTAAVQGNLHPQNAAVIGAAIKDARGELDAKEKIDIFGTRTEPINFDITELAPFLKYNDPNAKDADDDITKSFGRGIDFTSPYWKTMNASTARDWLGEVASKQSRYRMTYAEHPNIYKEVVQAAKAAQSI